MKYQIIQSEQVKEDYPDIMTHQFQVTSWSQGSTDTKDPRRNKWDERLNTLPQKNLEELQTKGSTTWSITTTTVLTLFEEKEDKGIYSV